MFLSHTYFGKVAGADTNDDVKRVFRSKQGIALVCDERKPFVILQPLKVQFPLPGLHSTSLSWVDFVHG